MKQSILTTMALVFFAMVPISAMSAEGTVSRAQFASAVLDREPVDELDAIGPGSDKVFFFTELRNMDGATITHRWSLNGESMAEVEFKVRASRWRVYSSKTLLPEWRGEWVVDVVDQNGSVIESSNIGYGDAETAGADQPAPMDTTSATDGASDSDGASGAAAEPENAGGTATEATEGSEPAATESSQQ